MTIRLDSKCQCGTKVAHRSTATAEWDHSKAIERHAENDSTVIEPSYLMRFHDESFRKQRSMINAVDRFAPWPLSNTF